MVRQRVAQYLWLKGNTYYFNATTSETSWTLPEGAELA